MSEQELKTIENKIELAVRANLLHIQPAPLTKEFMIETKGTIDKISEAMRSLKESFLLSSQETKDGLKNIVCNQTEAAKTLLEHDKEIYDLRTEHIRLDGKVKYLTALIGVSGGIAGFIIGLLFNKLF